MPSAVSLRDLTKAPSRWARNQAGTCVDGINLELAEDQFLGIVGPIGSGKTMLLRLIAGLEKSTSGDVSIGGQPMRRMPPRSREMGFMFQGFARFRQMTVRDNIGFGLKMNRVPKKERRTHVGELLELMGIEDLESRTSDDLTGEERHKVAFARSLAPRPDLLLLDRPFSGLDRRVLPVMKVDVKRWQRELRIPTILVTEYPLDALEVADRVAVMREGRVEEIEVSSRNNGRGHADAPTRFIGDVTPVRSRANGRQMGPRANLVEIAFKHDYMNMYQDRVPWSDPVVAAVARYAFKGRSVTLEVSLGKDGLGALAAPRHGSSADLSSSRALVDLSIAAPRTPSGNGHTAVSADLPANHDY